MVGIVVGIGLRDQFCSLRPLGLLCGAEREQHDASAKGKQQKHSLDGWMVTSLFSKKSLWRVWVGDWSLRSGGRDWGFLKSRGGDWG